MVSAPEAIWWPPWCIRSAWPSFLNLHLALERKDFVAADSARRLGIILPLQDGCSGSDERRRRPGVEPHIGGQPTSLAMMRPRTR